MMPRDGAMVLADYADQFEALTFACRKCDRRGRYRVQTLADRFGMDGKMPEIISGISADCPRRGGMSTSVWDYCGAYVVERPE